jgi:putative ABC transport system ATP-binding protein
MGPSGSGKTTLLLCAAGLDRPDSGAVRLDGMELDRLSERALAKLRRTRIGFVFQSFNLLDALTAEQNVTLPSRLSGRGFSRNRARAALARVGLADKAHCRPGELSGGEQQRVAVARALVGEPAVVFADEPTGALDLKSGRAVLDALRSAVDELGSTVLMVTHDPRSAARADLVVFLADGRLAGDVRDPTAEQVAQRIAALGD